MMKSDISIALCTYNGEKYIREQLESIINQSRPPDEIIVYDDCSSDGTINIIRNISDQYQTIKWKIFQNSCRIGVRANFEKAIKSTSCSYIATSDQDDIWEPNKLKLLKFELLKKHVALIHSDVSLIDENSNTIHTKFANNKKDTKSLTEYIFGENNISGCTCLFTKELKGKISTFPSAFYYHDQWLAIFAYNNGGIGFCDKKLIRYRIHSSNVVASLTNKRIIYKRKYFIDKSNDYLLLIKNKKTVKYSIKILLLLSYKYITNRIGLPHFKYNSQLARKIFKKNH